MKSYKQIFYSMPLSSVLLKPINGNYIIKDVNNTFTAAFGKTRENIVGKSIADTFNENSEQPETNWAEIYTSLNKVVSSGEANSINILRFDILNEDIGEFVERYWQIANTPIKDNLSGKIKFIQSILIEKTSEVLSQKITHSLEADLLTHIEKEKYFFDQNSDGLYSLDHKGNFINVNQGLLDITETSEEELLQMNFLPFCTSDTEQRVLDYFNKALKGESQNFEENFVSSTGREMTLNIFIVPFKIQEKIAGVYGIARDITKLKESENSRVKNDNRHRAMIQQGFDLISIIDSEGIFKFVSGASLSLFGISPEEFIGKNSFQSVHPEDIDDLKKQFFDLRRKDYIQFDPYRYQDINGNWRWIETKAMNLLKDPDVEGIVTNSRDITDLVQVSRERDQIYQRYNLAATATKDLIYDWNIITDNVLQFSKGSNCIFGYPAKKFEQKEFWIDLIHPDEINCLKKLITENLNNPKSSLISTQYRLKRANGTYAHLIDRGNIVRDKEGKALRVVGAITDISEIEKSKNDLKLANKRFSYAMKATKEMIWDWDIVNDHMLRGITFHKLYGYNPEENPSVENFWFSKIQETDRDEVVTSLQKAIKDTHTKKWRGEYCFQKENGDKAYVIDRAYILRDANGNAIRMIGAVLDVTESQKLLKKVESQNIILKDVAWEQSHIVRAPLARLKALLALLEEELYEEWDRDQLLQLINEAADELDVIIAKIIKKTEEIGVY